MKKPQKSITKDEMFLIKLYQAANALGDVYAEVDRFVIGKSIGQNDHCIHNIVRHLAQANFIKKSDGDAVYLTDQGLRLINELIDA